MEKFLKSSELHNNSFNFKKDYLFNLNNTGDILNIPLLFKTKCNKCDSINLFPINIHFNIKKPIYTFNYNDNIIFGCYNCNNSFKIDKNNFNNIINKLTKKGMFEF